MQDQPFVTVIVPVRNFERTINKTFEYLLKVRYPHESWEIIIADGGSTDNTPNIIESWQKRYDFIKLVKIPDCPSPAFARNKALDVAKGEFIFFTDGDCAPCKDWISIMLKQFMADEKIGAVGGEIYTLKVDQNNLTEAYCEHFKFNMVAPRYGFIGEGYFPPLSDRRPTQMAGHRAYFFVTANVAYRREALRRAKAQFWDHATGEDLDMCIQVRNDDWKLYFAPGAKVDHMHRGTFRALRKVWVSYGVAHPAILRKHSTDYFEIVFQIFKNSPTVVLPCGIRGFLYLGNFHFMHIFGFLFLAGLAISAFLPHAAWLHGLTLLAFLSMAYFIYRFSYWCWFMMPRRHFFIWLAMKYVTNLYFIRGGLKGSEKYKTFCVEPSF